MRPTKNQSCEFERLPPTSFVFRRATGKLFSYCAGTKASESPISQADGEHCHVVSQLASGECEHLIKKSLRELFQ